MLNEKCIMTPFFEISFSRQRAKNDLYSLSKSMVEGSLAANGSTNIYVRPAGLQIGQGLNHKGRVGHHW